MSGLVLGVGEGAGAKVHGVAQAGCAHDPSASGANRSGANSPAAPISVTASATGEAPPRARVGQSRLTRRRPSGAFPR